MPGSVTPASIRVTGGMPAPPFQLCAISAEVRARSQIITLSIAPSTVKFLPSPELRAPMSNGFVETGNEAELVPVAIRLPFQNRLKVSPLRSTTNCCQLPLGIANGPELSAIPGDV